LHTHSECNYNYTAFKMTFSSAYIIVLIGDTLHNFYPTIFYPT